MSEYVLYVLAGLIVLLIAFLLLRQILAGMKDRIPLASLSIQSVVKNNNVQLDGLTIMEGGTNLSPTIYLNYFYETRIAGERFL